MVLQRAPQRAVVWGFGNSKALTTLTMNNKTYTTKSRSEIANAQNESIWSVTLDSVSNEGPFNITVSQLSTSGVLLNITIRNVLFGDVWICSGQSNMQMTVGMTYNATEEIQNAGNYSKIRLLTVMTRSSPVPLEELMSIILRWSVASPTTVGGYSWGHMSAVCWLYGRMIHKALGGRPIGLIATSWVGTSIEFWSPPQALEDCNATT
jgi:sialate O-acetylesterase